MSSSDFTAFSCIRFPVDYSQNSNYNVITKAKLIQIGNSRGIRLPKSLIEQAGLRDSVEIDIRGDQIILQRAKKDPRAGWDKSIAKAVAEHGHDVDEEFLNMPNEFDEKEWTW